MKPKILILILLSIIPLHCAYYPAPQEDSGFPDSGGDHENGDPATGTDLLPSPCQSDQDCRQDQRCIDGVCKAELTFVVENRLDQPRYIRWKAPNHDPVACETAAGGGWTGCHFFQTNCAVPCLEEYLGEKCCQYCDPGITMTRILAPGESIGVDWNGILYTYDDRHCSDCSCYREEPAPRGDYRAVVCVHDDYLCGNPPCPAATEDGLLYDTFPSGNQTCHASAFTVVHGEDTLEIPIE